MLRRSTHTSVWQRQRSCVFRLLYGQQQLGKVQFSQQRGDPPVQTGSKEARPDGDEDFGAKWQAKGDHYISYHNLRLLHDQLRIYRPETGRAAKKLLQRDLHLTYFARFHNLLRDEYQFEKRTVEDRLKTWPLSRLVKEGFTLTNLKASSKGFLHQDKLYRFKPAHGTSSKQLLPPHKFAVGDTVRITVQSHNPRKESNRPLQNAITGIVIDRRPQYLDVCFSDAIDIEPNPTYRLDACVNRIAYDRMMTALQFFVAQSEEDPAKKTVSKTLRDVLLYSYPNAMLRIADSPGGLRLGLPVLQTVFDDTASYSTADINERMKLTQSIDVDLQPKHAAMGQLRPVDSTACSELAQALQLDTAIDKDEVVHPVFLTNERLRSLLLRNTTNNPDTVTKVEQALDDVARLQELSLNQSQRNAILHSFQQSISLIQGPPGTGKTKTACALLASLVHLHRDRNQAHTERSKVLACAHSNVATDNLLEGLIALGVNVVRLGRPVNVRSELWNHTLDAKLQANEDWAEARTNLEMVLEEFRDAKEAGSPYLSSLQREIGKARSRLTEIEQELVKSILLDSEVIISTSIGAGCDTLRDFIQSEGVRIRTVLIDEAAQCSELSVLPAIVHGCDKLVLIGDQNQLPPVVLSPDASEQGLGVSMFSRLLAAGISPSLLNEQYRMHPKIAEFPSKHFYSGQLVSRTSPASRLPPEGFAWSNMHVPVVFLDLSSSQSVGFEVVSSSSMSYFNDAEVEVVTNVVEMLKNGGDLSLRDIGVITPYSAQVRRLVDCFRAKGWLEAGATLSDSFSGHSQETAAERISNPDCFSMPLSAGARAVAAKLDLDSDQHHGQAIRRKLMSELLDNAR